MSKHNKGNGIYFETESTTGWIFNKAFIPTGRIKRMRKRIILGGIAMLNKRLGKRTHQVRIMYFYHTITRWNRH